MIVKTRSFIGSLENHRKILKHLKEKYNQNQIIALTILKTISKEYNITWITENVDRELNNV